MWQLLPPHLDWAIHSIERRRSQSDEAESRNATTVSPKCQLLHMCIPFYLFSELLLCKVCSTPIKLIEKVSFRVYTFQQSTESEFNWVAKLYHPVARPVQCVSFSLNSTYAVYSDNGGRFSTWKSITTTSFRQASHFERQFCQLKWQLLLADDISGSLLAN